MPRIRLPLWAEITAASLFALLGCLAIELAISRRIAALYSWEAVTRGFLAAVVGGWATYVSRSSVKAREGKSSPS